MSWFGGVLTLVYIVLVAPVKCLITDVFKQTPGHLNLELSKERARMEFFIQETPACTL